MEISVFKDSEFELACKELEEPQTDGWEFFTESHGVTIYRQYNEVCLIMIRTFLKCICKMHLKNIKDTV